MSPTTAERNATTQPQVRDADNVAQTKNYPENLSDFSYNKIKFSDDKQSIPTDPASASSSAIVVHEQELTQPHNDQQGWRVNVGNSMGMVSTVVNENIITARYATFATIALLSAYGISRTPLFFRYKTVSDIPASQFLARRTVYGRVVRIVENDAIPAAVDQPIVCYIRHLSPCGRLLNRSAFDFFLRASPAAAVGKTLEDSSDDLLRVEIAGIQKPPMFMAPTHLEQPGKWLNRLADQRTFVTCELMARRIKKDTNTSPTGKAQRGEYTLPKLDGSDTTTLIRNGEYETADHQTAIGRIRYRPTLTGASSIIGKLPLFRTDLASSLVRFGRANVLSTGMYLSEDDSRLTLDNSSCLSDLRKDVSYLERLGEMEFDAVKESLGMWADPQVRETRQDLVEEATFEATASFFQKAWRWWRG